VIGPHPLVGNRIGLLAMVPAAQRQPVRNRDSEVLQDLYKTPFEVVPSARMRDA
jgi:hypothetical protein